MDKTTETKIPMIELTIPRRATVFGFNMFSMRSTLTCPSSRNNHAEPKKVIYKSKDSMTSETHIIGLLKKYRMMTSVQTASRIKIRIRPARSAIVFMARSMMLDNRLIIEGNPGIIK
jgi:hypothetical protein